MAEHQSGVDLFVSYTGADRAWAEWISWQLESAGHRVLVQAWDFRPSENFVVQMRRALDTAERTLAVVSAAYLASVYGSDEWTAAFIHEHPDTMGLVVVRVEDVPLPRLLRPWIYIDLVGLDAEAAAAALLAGLEPGRRKPSQPPSFPSAFQPAGAVHLPSSDLANLPPRNPNFTGRQQLLDQLAHNLQAGSVTAVVGQEPSGQASSAMGTTRQALAGMGGVGKTQLALEYAYRHAADYDLRWWIPAEEPLAIPATLAALARRLGLGEQADQEETVAAVLAELGRQDRWLLVFDNAVDPKDLAGYLPSGSGHVLVTTRSRAFGGIATRLHVGVFDHDEATAFLQARTGIGEWQAAEAVAHELGDLPLALEQAAALMDQTGLSLREYLEVYRQYREVLLEKGEPIAYGATVEVTFGLAIGRVARQSPAAVELLRLCAYLAPQVIPHRLLTAKLGELPRRLRRVMDDQLTYAETVGALHGFSLVEREPAGLGVHRLVQAVTRHRLDPKLRATWATRAVHLVLADWPDETRLPVAWPQCEQLLPHALAATEHAEGLTTAHEATGALLIKVGQYLEGRAELSAARTIFERALVIAEALYQPDHRNVARALNNLGAVLARLGDRNGARAHHERALAIEEMVYGPNHPQVAHTLTNLGVVLDQLAELPTARAHVERALAIKEAVYGPDHPEVAATLGTLGHVLGQLGDRNGARAYLERALAIKEAVYGSDHIEVADTLRLLGGILLELGDRNGARAYLERALAIKEAVYGSDHLEIATTLATLGTVLNELGDPQAARAHLERALVIKEEAYGPNHPEVAATLGSLGLPLGTLGELQAARLHLERAVTILERAYGPDHPQVGKALVSLGLVLGKLEGLPAVRPHFERALVILEGAYGPDHPDVAQVLEGLGLVLRRLGELAAAEVCEGRAQAIRRRLGHTG